MPIKVLIADDDILIREGLKIILQNDERFEVTACVENGLQAIQYCESQKVDIVLLDVRMPVMDGLQASREISEKTTVKPLILTTFDDDDFILTAVKNGSRGYLLKNSSPDRIMDAIKMVYEGGIVMQDSVMKKIREELVTNPKVKIAEDLFSDREMDIIKLISKGLANREIAKELYVSEGTVKNHITSILNKTELEHRTQIAIYYLTGSRS
ncbi:fructose response regulator of fruA and EII fructose [Dehalobacter sp. UNSWDHB]|jgi:DNA-binding NarL/FixJ family response regulator|uniref:response regulator transcription factor n=1 Tax=unclassified Dehalobacter TaxID=2635733 RepID=UPI00028B6DE6|nr:MULTISPECIES: response regulator transcription factor [unclassified Dehalobacter]AFV03865.1 fructose response regulator of fruA and EII fructose/mannose [Dehalobacter sp. DCA]AFV06844.1 fructose response regulator of fruA and EII fructose/mannose [Dehalobacter sp. CF]EQB21398.1 fructose response regulator of fruA and EII fructose [Dehalobacter sp. UNSWDHB]